MNTLTLYLIVYSVILGIQFGLLILNYRYVRCPSRQRQAMQALGLDETKLKKMNGYFTANNHFSMICAIIRYGLSMGFLLFGGITLFETISQTAGGNTIITGLIFFGLLWLVTTLIDLPISYYRQFVIEQKYGFNTSTKKLFWTDQCKGMILSLIFMSCVFAVFMLIIANFTAWWLGAWLFSFGISMLGYWFIPAFIMPLFNKFEPINETSGDTKLFHAIQQVAQKINFPLKDIQQMNASIRSTHGNAYFVGLFKKKQIVFYDTLLKLLNVNQTVAVLAHELGHYKLNHVRNSLISQFITLGLILYLLWMIVGNSQLALDFGFDGPSPYAALFFIIIFQSSIISPIQSPIKSALSRKNEFAADKYAAAITPAEDLVSALIKITEDHHIIPVVHPLYSRFHYSHPPIVERVAALRALA